MKRYKILKGKITWGKPGQACQSSWGLAGNHCVMLSVLMELVEDSNLTMLGILSRDPWDMILPLLTHACLPSKDFLGSLA